MASPPERPSSHKALARLSRESYRCCDVVASLGGEVGVQRERGEAVCERPDRNDATPGLFLARVADGVPHNAEQNLGGRLTRTGDGRVVGAVELRPEHHLEVRAVV